MGRSQLVGGRIAKRSRRIASRGPSQARRRSVKTKSGCENVFSSHPGGSQVSFSGKLLGFGPLFFAILPETKSDYRGDQTPLSLTMATTTVMVHSALRTIHKIGCPRKVISVENYCMKNT